MRHEFTANIKFAAFERSDGLCEACKCHLFAGRLHYDHRIPDALGGKPELSNCQVLCTDCHAKKTAGEDIPLIAKSRRIRKRAAGIKKPRTITAWRRFDGSIVHTSRVRH